MVPLFALCLRIRLRVGTAACSSVPPEKRLQELVPLFAPCSQIRIQVGTTVCSSRPQKKRLQELVPLFALLFPDKDVNWYRCLSLSVTGKGYKSWYHCLLELVPLLVLLHSLSLEKQSYKSWYHCKATRIGTTACPPPCSVPIPSSKVVCVFLFIYFFFSAEGRRGCSCWRWADTLNSGHHHHHHHHCCLSSQSGQCVSVFVR